jgi:hypothetical protein
VRRALGRSVKRDFQRARATVLVRNPASLNENWRDAAPPRERRSISAAISVLAWFGGGGGSERRMHRLRLVSCGPTLGRLRPFAAYVMAVTSTR